MIRHEHQLPLLSRDAFREQVLARDGRCVICGRTDRPLDAHHIIERRLFRDGGYHLDNGAALCDDRAQGCHTLAEQTRIGPDEIRSAANITVTVLPDHLYGDARWTKWGDLEHEDSTRSPGELFWDPSVQKILAEGGVLGRYDTRVRYPRTSHTPWSAGKSSDDRTAPHLNALIGSEIVVSAKLDGQNMTLYADGLHGRSPRGKARPGQGQARALQARIGHELPDGWRVCAENLELSHTLRYDGLPTPVVGLSLWDAQRCLSWDETQAYFDMLGLMLPPVLWRGVPQSAEELRRVMGLGAASGHEGSVARVAGQFTLRDFPTHVVKTVRADFARARDARHGLGPGQPNGVTRGAADWNGLQIRWPEEQSRTTEEKRR